MNLNILVSKKGTLVVTAYQLFQSLLLPDHKYDKMVNKWINDVYEFGSEIRQPVVNKDFASIIGQDRKHRDYYLSLELAIRIALRTDSSVKIKVAQYLNDSKVFDSASENPVMSKSQVEAILELTRAMSLISCQNSVEQLHQKLFTSINGKGAKWWSYRAQLLGYSPEHLKEKMLEIGKQYRGKDLKTALLTIDRYELIRLSIIDLFIALGETEGYARKMGGLAKLLAKEIQLPIHNDLGAALPFPASKFDRDLVADVIQLPKKGKPGPRLTQFLKMARA